MRYGTGFWSEELGQDVVEYTLLLAFVVVIAAAILLLNSADVASIWNKTTAWLESARSFARGRGGGD